MSSRDKTRTGVARRRGDDAVSQSTRAGHAPQWTTPPTPGVHDTRSEQPPLLALHASSSGATSSPARMVVAVSISVRGTHVDDA